MKELYSLLRKGWVSLKADIRKADRRRKRRDRKRREAVTFTLNSVTKSVSETLKNLPPHSSKDLEHYLSVLENWQSKD